MACDNSSSLNATQASQKGGHHVQYSFAPFAAIFILSGVNHSWGNSAVAKNTSFRSALVQCVLGVISLQSRTFEARTPRLEIVTAKNILIFCFTEPLH